MDAQDTMPVITQGLRQGIYLMIFSYTRSYNNKRFVCLGGCLLGGCLLDDASFGGATPTPKKILAFLAHIRAILALSGSNLGLLCPLCA